MTHSEVRLMDRLVAVARERFASRLTISMVAQGWGIGFGDPTQPESRAGTGPNFAEAAASALAQAEQ